MTEIILDYIKGIKLNSDLLPLENIQLLNILPHGIYCLAQTVRAEEIQNNNEKLSFSFGDINPIILSAFDWFVISVTNYTRVVGLLDLMIQKGWKKEDLAKKENHLFIKKYCDAYVEEIIPNVNKWRKKVAAHPAATDPRPEDNLATIECSLMQLITYIEPYYQVGAKWNTHGQESELPPWALTEVFEKNLAPRFWPEMKLKPIK